MTEDSYWGEDNNPLSLNLYTYCHNDPIQYIDPSGHVEAYLTDLITAVGGTYKWDEKKKEVVVYVNGVERTLKLKDYKRVNNKIVIDNKAFDNLFTDTSKGVITKTTVGKDTISGITYNYTNGCPKPITGTFENNLQAKQSPNPKQQENFVLKVGADNNEDDVKVLQLALVVNNFDIKVDGKYGDETRLAVFDFQAKVNESLEAANKYGHQDLKKILQDGKVGKETWAKLGLPLDSGGNPDRNSEAYKKLLEIANSGKSISYDEFYKILSGSEDTEETGKSYYFYDAHLLPEAEQALQYLIVLKSEAEKRDDQKLVQLCEEKIQLVIRNGSLEGTWEKTKEVLSEMADDVLQIINESGDAMGPVGMGVVGGVKTTTTKGPKFLSKVASFFKGLFKSGKADDVILDTVRTIDKVQDFERALTAADLGIDASKLTELTGTFKLVNGKAFVSVDMIEGKLGFVNPAKVIDNLIKTAKEAGASSIRIQGTVANTQLLNVLSKRYNFVTTGSGGYTEYIDIIIN